jgi:hypothetical protein
MRLRPGRLLRVEARVRGPLPTHEPRETAPNGELIELHRPGPTRRAGRGVSVTMNHAMDARPTPDRRTSETNRASTSGDPAPTCDPVVATHGPRIPVATAAPSDEPREAKNATPAMTATDVPVPRVPAPTARRTPDVPPNDSNATIVPHADPAHHLRTLPGPPVVPPVVTAVLLLIVDRVRRPEAAEGPRVIVPVTLPTAGALPGPPVNSPPKK